MHRPIAGSGIRPSALPNPAERSGNTNHDHHLAAATGLVVATRLDAVIRNHLAGVIHLAAAIRLVAAAILIELDAELTRSRAGRLLPPRNDWKTC